MAQYSPQLWSGGKFYEKQIPPAGPSPVGMKSGQLPTRRRRGTTAEDAEDAVASHTNLRYAGLKRPVNLRTRRSRWSLVAFQRRRKTSESKEFGGASKS